MARATCPACSARIGWITLVLAPAAPFFLRCRGCRTRLRLESPSAALQTLFAGSLAAGAALLAAAELDLFTTMTRVVLCGLAAGLACAIVVGAVVLRSRLVTVGTTPDDRRYRWLAPMSGLVVVVVIALFTLLAAMQVNLSAIPAGIDGPTGDPAAPVGSAERAWRWVGLDGEETTLGAMLDRPLVVNAWAT